MIEIYSCPHPLFVREHIHEWKRTHDGFHVHVGFDNIDTSSDSLFYAFPPLYIIADSVVVDDIKRLQQYPEDIFIICSRPPKKKSWGKGISYCNMSKPSKSDMGTIAKSLDIDSDDFKRIYKTSKDPESVATMILQSSLLDEIHSEDIVDIIPHDSPPWDITNAIVNGDVKNALKSYKSYISLHSSRSSKISLVFALIGYMKKVIAAEDDVAGISSKFFHKQSENLCDTDGIIDDIATYAEFSMKCKEIDTIVKCMIIGMSGRFQSEKDKRG